MPTQILVEHICKLVEKLQLRPLIGRGKKHQYAIDPVSYLLNFSLVPKKFTKSRVTCVRKKKEFLGIHWSIPQDYLMKSEPKFSAEI